MIVADGCRKTQIAIEYAYWIQEKHDDVSIFWVHASNAERFRESYASLARKCKVPGHDDAKADTMQLVKEWLEDESRGWWLMVIDNADDAKLFLSSEGLGRYIPDSNHVSLLVTTRDKHAAVVLSKGRPPIEVSAMNVDESKQLLRANLGTPHIASDELSELSERLEHLPLALAQAAAFIEARTITVGKYLQLLKTSDRTFISLLSEDFDTVGKHPEAIRAVAETWIISFEQIQRQSAMAAALLSLMSLFDRQAVAAEFLKAYLTRRSDDWSDLELAEALGRLKAFSLIIETKDDTFDMHRLVQLVTRKWLREGGTMNKFAGHALLALSHSYPYGSYENWAVCSNYLPHVNAVLQAERTGSQEEMTAKATLLHNTSVYLMHQCRWEEAERLLLEAVQIRQAALGFDQTLTMNSTTHLAWAYSYQGQWKKAEELLIEIMYTSKAKLGADHPYTIAKMANLALMYSNQGQWKEAEKLQAEVMENYKTKLGADHPDTLTIMAHLAMTFSNQERWKEAEKLHAEIAETRMANLGADHPKTLTCMANLAAMFSKQRRWKEAEMLQAEVMKTRMAKFGVDHPDTLASMISLARTFARQGRLEEAEKLEVEVIETCVARFGADHPSALAGMHNLAITRYRQGRIEDALVLMQDCVHLRGKKFGLDHPHTKSSVAALNSMKASQ